ncbi:mas-related G-protein coupled receptor member X2-like [Pipistrellus kuhlii]|uniref:mas-related G-protein coupled receptor member X2-like n=1 Tax=Pipistrellus kuhlii TaxID=59472 RepID=UPI001E26F9E5|nr:mas-related G-protein coupled receptor member X2-like [Pipistrellus kuhlii]
MNPSITAWSSQLTSISGEQTFKTEFTILQLLIVIVALVGLAGNAVVIWLLGFRMRRNTFSVYILNLAGADFLLLCCYIMDALERLIWDFSLIKFIPKFFITVSIFAYISGLSFLSAISTERCMSVLWPIWYRCHRHRHWSAGMCALLWALSLLLSILEGNYCGFLVGTRHYFWCPVLDFITMAWLILLFVLLSGSSLALMTRLLCGSLQVLPTRLYVTILLTVLFFLLCGLPFGIYWFLVIWFQYFDALVPHVLVAVLLSCVNSCANPIIYFFVGSFGQRWWKQRHALRLVLQRALQDTPEMDEHGENLPGETMAMSESLVS